MQPGARIASLLSQVSIALLVSACSTTATLTPVVAPPAGLERLPVAVGVHYSPEFREAMHARAKGSTKVSVPIGKGSVVLFDSVFPMLFDPAVPVASRPPLASGTQSVAAVIEPRVEAFDFTWPTIALPGTSYTAEITYRFTLYSEDGTPFASWLVSGYGERPVDFEKLKTGSPVGDASSLAMKDAARKFLTGFREVPELQRWLRQSVGAEPAAKGSP
jgi:hypothetical protein